MSLIHLIRQARAMPPGEVAKKALRHAGRVLRNRFIGKMMRNQCTYPPLTQVDGPLARRLPAIDRTVLAANADALCKLAQASRAHRFDLLGSGPVKVAYGERYAGFGRRRYGPGPKINAENWRDWAAGQLWRGNHVRSRLLLDFIEDSHYRPIDWQVDFVSGYRWSVRTFGPSIAYGHQPGVDVKVPWELARLQHLPPLALAYGLDGDAALVAEFRHQVLDFLGSNPPGWGVNWACAMDVAIRAVNILVARDLFLAFGAALDEEFEEELVAAMLAHARHVAGHLEWNENHRGNHYLADICGLAWIATYLPQTAESDTLLALAIQELGGEIERQFGHDGANFEASTAYHRLSAEMALYTVALILGLPEERRAMLETYDHEQWRRRPPLRKAPQAWPPFSGTALDRLARAARFMADVTKPSGEIVQIGDNDSGRFLNLTPGLGPLDCSHLIAAAKGLFELDLPTPPQAGVETAVIAALAGCGQFHFATDPQRTVAGQEPDQSASRATRVVISGALGELKSIAYPDFGLFIWKNDHTFVSVRCGPIGQNGQGGHAHNDQLAVEIEIDGVQWTRDPGTFVYTSDMAARNAYRSVLAHFAPRHGTDEPARMLSPFSLEDHAQARLLRFDETGFLGRHNGFGERVWRRVTIAADAVIIEDCWGGPQIGPATAVEEFRPAAPAELGLDLPFSPGYGRREQP